MGKEGIKMNFCKDCKWYELDKSFDYKKAQVKFAMCDCPKNLIYTIDLITGKDIVRRRYRECSTQREVPWLVALLFKTCGKGGRWYERSNL